MSRFETRPDLLATLPNHIAGVIRTRLPALRDCRGMAGRLDVDVVKKHGIAAPAVLVSRLRAVSDREYSGPLFTFRVQIAAFIVTKDELGLTRHEAAANISQALLGMIPGADWGLSPDEIMHAERVQEEPLVSGGSEGQALAISVVTWEHILSVHSLPAEEIVSPELYIGFAPLIGAAHESDYTQVGGEP